MTIRVLVVDDSLVMRNIIQQALSKDSGIEVVGHCQNAMEAREAIKTLNPDVVTLDIEMPGMDGITFLEKIMALRPMPVIMISSLTQRGADATIKALKIGAVECIGKPSAGESMELFFMELLTKVKMAAVANITFKSKKLLNAKADELKQPFPLKKISADKIIGIGSSTGGVQALHEVLSVLPAEIPPIVIVQHIQDNFVESFASSLRKICRFPIYEVINDTVIQPGRLYIASGGMHMEVQRVSGTYKCIRKGTEKVSGHLPSVDVLFSSLAECAGANAVGVILTGMGKDGAQGLLAMRQAGAKTIGQNAATCVVYGMPRVANELGATEVELPLNKIAPQILQVLN
jgi:two-component system, chemotaxis family, protein-glutamate methylesterase/glutaminase